MEYSDHTFSKIRFKNKDDELPEVRFEYTAVAADDTVKEATDEFTDLPHATFREAWTELVQFWKQHIETVIGTVDWDLNEARVTTIKLDQIGGNIASVRYWVTVQTIDDEAVTIATPEVLVGETERQLLRDVCEAAIKYLEGARDQRDLFDDDPSGDGFPDHMKN